MSSLQDVVQRMQIQQLENAITRSEHEIRKAKAEADLAELILKHARDNSDKLSLPKASGHFS